MCDAQAAVARQPRGRRARRGMCSGSSSAPGHVQNGACTRKQTTPRERGTGGRKGGGGVPSSRDKLAAAVGGKRGAGTASGGSGKGGAAAHLFAHPKLDHRNGATACQKQGGEGERGG